MPGKVKQNSTTEVNSEFYTLGELSENEESECVPKNLDFA